MIQQAKAFFTVILFVLFCLFEVKQTTAQSGYNFIGRIYHNTVHRYNAYYNASNKMNAGQRGIDNTLQDDYSKILPIDKSELATGASIPDIDSILTRLTVANKIHSKSKWIDDCNLLIGESYYLKKDYESALQSFQYIVGSYRPPKSKKVVTERNQKGKKLEYDGVKLPWLKPKPSLNQSFIKHQPVKDEAVLWLVTCYIKLKKYYEAETIIKMVEKNYDFSFKYRALLEARYAQMMIDQERYKEAIRPLIHAIAMTEKKSLRRRYVYILAQLYQITGNSDKSIKAFKDVLTLHPDYRMDFNARINIARSFSGKGKTSANEVFAILEKMARDSKYEEFLDQIYYTMAEVYLVQNDKDKAMDYLQLSVQSSVNNNHQKGLSFLKMGELTFSDQRYRPSKFYHDSTLQFISKSFEEIDDVQSRSAILTNLVNQLTIIHDEDSVIALANMSEGQRKSALQKALLQIEKQKQLELQRQNQLNKVQTGAGNQTQQGSSFYFYNPTQRANGYNEFIKDWGNRKLEDHWRRANKMSDMNSDVDTSQTAKKEEKKLTLADLEAGLPLTQEKMETCTKHLTEAYYAAGTIFKEDLHNDKKAIEYFEKLVDKYPKSAFEPQALYQLYLLYERKPDEAKAAMYKNKLLTDYPDQALTKHMLNPSAQLVQQVKTDVGERYYNYAYRMYSQNQYAKVIIASDSARKFYNKSAFMPKFDLLRAFAIAQTKGKDSLKTELSIFTLKYPSGEEHNKAKEILAMLDKNSKNEPQKKVNDAPSKSDFEYKPNASQFVVVLFDEVINTNKSISDSLNLHNGKFRSSENLKVSTMLLDEARQMILVKQFKNSQIALNYYNEILSKETLFDLIETTYHVFIIDEKNFGTFFKTKNLDLYMAFFDSNYK